MAIKVTCPSCKHRFKVPEEYAGRKGRCPKCKEVFRAPDLEVFEEVDSDSQNSLAGDEWLDDEPAPPPPQSAAPAPVPQVKSGKKRSSSSAPDLGSLEDSFGPTTPAVASVKLSGPGRGGKGKGGAKRKKSAGRNSSGQDEGLPKWVLPAGIGAAIFTLLVIVGLAVFLTSSDDTPIADNGDTTTEPESPGDASAPDTPRQAEQLPDPDPTPQSLATDWDRLHAGIVTMTIVSNSGTEKALGFLIDPSGLVVAHYHDVMAPGVSAIRAEVDGLQLDFSGAVAASRDLDLVLLKLNLVVPVPLTSFELAEAEPLGRASLYAASNVEGEKGLTPTLLERVMQSGELPASAVAVLRERRIDESNPMFWIETSVPAPDTAAGGPLLNAQGKVVGMNTTLSPSSPHGFAVHMRHLAKLLEHAREEAVPLEPSALASLQEDLREAQPGTGEVAQTDPTDEPTDAPADEPGQGGGVEDPVEPAGGLASPTEADMELSPAGIARVHEVCESFDFMPTTMAEYQWLQLLTIFIDSGEAYVENPTNGVPQEVRTQIAEAVAEEMSKLADLEFTPERIAAINRFAGEVLAGNSDAYVCFYTTVVDSTTVTLSSGLPAALCNLDGSQQRVVLPMTRETRSEVVAGTRWFVFGQVTAILNYTENGEQKVVPQVKCRYGIGEN